VRAPATAEGGGLALYLEPVGQEAVRLTFRLREIAAVAEDGTKTPLALALRDVAARDVQRERLLAAGELAPGTYSGLALTVESASLQGGGPGGDSKLLLPDEPTLIAQPFEIAKRRAVVLTLEFQYRDSIDSGFRFVPLFSPRIPGKLATGLIGVASSSGSSEVTVFDKLSGRIAAVIPTEREPAGMALHQERRRAYVAILGDDAVQTIDLLENAVIDRLALSAGDDPVELALTPDARTLLVANRGSDTVSFVDPGELFEADRVRVGRNPRSIVVDREGVRAYVFNFGSNSISVLDVSRRAVAATIPTESGPVRGKLDRAGTRLFVIHESSPNLTVIDPSALTVEARVYVGAGATALEVDTRSDRIYVARRNTGTIEIYDPMSLLPVDSIAVEGNVAFMSIDPEGNNLFIVLADRDEVRIVRLANNRIVARTDLGRRPYWVSIMGER
jgi:YVTN family beta-propeller protein